MLKQCLFSASLAGCFLVGSCTDAATTDVFFRQNSAPINDKELETALASLFTNELGYTLLGAKPASIQEGRSSYLHEHPEVAKRLFPFLTQTFKNSSGFILKISGEWDTSYDIEFFNIKALKKVIREHQELQIFIKKKFISLDGFFSHLRRTKKTIFETLNHEAFFLGLIFGYGRENSEYYCRVNEVSAHLKNETLFSLVSNDLKPHVCGHDSLSFFSLSSPSESCKGPITKGEIDSLEDEWELLQKIRWDITDSSRPKPPFYIHLPFYICRHGDDSERVRNKYIKARDRLAHLFYNRSFSEVIVETASKIKGKPFVKRCILEL